MIINEIEIFSFGKLENRHFVFSDGLNLLQGSNECGKTTLMSFIKFMLYGTKIRKDTSGVTFKEKYMPWNGNTMSGSMTVTDDFEKKYIITRFVSDTKNSLEIIDAFTGGDVSDKKILANPGKYFTSLSEDSFSYTAFLSATSAIVKSDKDGEIIEKLSNVAVTGNEKISYNAAIEKINEEILSLSSEKRKNSILPRLKKELFEKQNKIKELEALCERIKNENEEISALENERETLKKRLFDEKNTSDNDELKKAADKLAEFDTRDEMKFSAITAEEELCGKNFEKYISKLKLTKTSVTAELFAAIIFAALSAAGCVFVYCAALFCVLFICGVFYLKENSKQISKAKNVFAKYGCANALEFTAGIEKYKKTMNEKADFLTAAGTNIFNENGKKTLNDFTISNKSDKILMISENINKIDVKLALLKERVNSEENSEIMLVSAKEQCEMIEKEIISVEQRLAALKIAAEALNTAFEKMKTLFSPPLAKKTAEILADITGNVHSELKADENFNVKLKDEGCYKNIFLYSRGTCEQMYFALRTALCELTASGIALPMFFDDAFSAYDDNRLYNVLKFIEKEAKNRQIFVSSCRSSEFIFFRNTNANIIKLQ